MYRSISKCKYIYIYIYLYVNCIYAVSPSVIAAMWPYLFLSKWMGWPYSVTELLPCHRMRSVIARQVPIATGSRVMSPRVRPHNPLVLLLKNLYHNRISLTLEPSCEPAAIDQVR
jgi:hypothetical protein